MLPIAVLEPLRINIGKFTVLFGLYIANRVIVVFYYDYEYT